uniref:Uncharacterized protein n=1 Tax=viral metagenome TaxID=1070528 RepID=A0A6M3LMH6_9ZZZZ
MSERRHPHDTICIAPAFFERCRPNECRCPVCRRLRPGEFPATDMNGRPLGHKRGHAEATNSPESVRKQALRVDTLRDAPELQGCRSPDG